MARTFAANGKYIDIGTADISATTMTVHAWGKFDDFTQQNHIVSKWNGSSCWLLYTEATTGTLNFIVQDSGSANSTAVGTTGLSTGTWYSIGGVQEGTGASQLKQYLNGVNEGSNTGKTIRSAGTQMRIGHNSTDGGPVGVRGSVAEVALWDVALTAAEMAALAKGVSPLLIRPKNLKGYWPLWGAGSPEADLSGTGVNGTLTGSPAVANHAPVGRYVADFGALFSSTAASPDTIPVPLISPATTVYAPTLSGTGVASLAVPFIAATTTLYSISLAGQAMGVSIAFDDDLLEPNPAWTRIDDQIRVARWEIRRGRQDEREKTETGEATIFVKDTEGWLDPANVSSPWFGKLDGKQVALARWNPVTQQWYTRFRGTIEEYGHDLSPTQNVDEVAIVCVGFMDYLNSAQMAPGVSGHPGGPAGVVFYDDQDANDRVNDIHADAGFPPELYVTFSLNVVMQETRYDGGYSYLAGIFDAADAEFPGVSNVFEDRFGRVCVHGRHARFDPDSVAADAGNDAWDFNRWKLGDGDAITGDSNYAQLRPPLHADRSLKNVINSALVTPYGIDAGAVAGQVVSDPTSIAAYGVRSYSAQDLRVLEHKTNGDTGAEQCEKVGDFYVTNYKDPRTRPRQATIKSLAPDDARAAKTWLLMSKVDISDVVHLKVTFPGGGGFDEDFYVEGITESSRPGGPFTPIGDEYAIDEVTLDLSPTAYYNEDTFPDDT